MQGWLFVCVAFIEALVLGCFLLGNIINYFYLPRIIHKFGVLGLAFLSPNDLRI